MERYGLESIVTMKTGKVQIDGLAEETFSSGSLRLPVAQGIAMVVKSTQEILQNSSSPSRRAHAS
jgi:hypothetical protein